MKISVVIPVYNAEKTLENTLSSVMKQTILPLEIICVNDGSTDNSLVLLEKFAKGITPVPIKIINKKNGGVSTARNAGIKASSGDWIALLDSDDEWLPNKLEIQQDILSKNPQIDFLGTTRNGEVIPSILWKKLGKLTKITAKNLLIRFVFVTPTVLFKKEIVEKIGYFDESQRYAEEGNYFIRIAKHYNCYLLNLPLVITGGGKAHFGESGLSGNIWGMEKGELKNIRDAHKMGVLSSFEYPAVLIFSLTKYFRRWLIVKLKKK